MMELQLAHDSSGKAADTGSAMHAAAFEWHRTREREAALDYMRDRLPDFPLADTFEAERLFRAYADDPRNQEAEIILAEARGQVAIAPAAYDPTGEPILVSGHPDQVRREDGVLRLWDIKTGQRLDGLQMVHEHAIQLAAYCLIAEDILGETVHPGGIIRIRGYFFRGKGREDVSPPRVFWHLPWGREDIDLILNPVRDAVARVRRGELYPSGGPHCSFCPARGQEVCIPALKEFLSSP